MNSPPTGSSPSQLQSTQPSSKPGTPPQPLCHWLPPFEQQNPLQPYWPAAASRHRDWSDRGGSCFRGMVAVAPGKICVHAEPSADQSAAGRVTINTASGKPGSSSFPPSSQGLHISSAPRRRRLAPLVYCHSVLFFFPPLSFYFLCYSSQQQQQQQQQQRWCFRV